MQQREEVSDAQLITTITCGGDIVLDELLSSGETYQLWGIIHGKTISLGLLGRTPHLAVFTAAGSLRPHALGVSIEAGSGARQPSGSMLAYGVPH